MNINTEESILKNQIKKYFNFIKKKKFNKLEELLNNKITLHDGKLRILGRKNLINFTKKIFYLETFKIHNQITILNKKHKIAFSRFNLKLKNKNYKIIDEFYFDKDFKISKIIVYKF